MSNYASVLRSSRLVALPPTLRSAAHDNHFPTKPTIRTTKANHNIGDWGLKRPMPRLRTQNISITDIDTQEHHTPFDSSNRFTKFVQRWQEMGIPIQKPVAATTLGSPKTYDTGALFENVNKGIHIKTMPRRDAKRLINRAREVRASILASEVVEGPFVYTAARLEKFRALGTKRLGILPEIGNKHLLQANGGLAYHFRGALSLFNTPDGPRERQLIARLLRHNNRSSIGLGGMVATLKDVIQDRNVRLAGRAATLRVYQPHAKIDHQGKLELELETKVPETFDMSKRAAEMAFSEIRTSGSSDLSDDGYDENDMVPVHKASEERKRARMYRNDAARMVGKLENLSKTIPKSFKDGSEQ